MWAGEGSPAAIVQKEGLAQTSDTGEIEQFVAGVLSANEKAVADYKSGKTNILGFLTGQVMKASRGKANPELVNELLRKRLE
jgi:aspartyl-tRNA(Asn)/glutamyl-tRNA(Gln) amidotransferase subunit B